MHTDQKQEMCSKHYSLLYPSLFLSFTLIIMFSIRLSLRWSFPLKVVYHKLKNSKFPVFIRTEKYIAYSRIKKVSLFFLKKYVENGEIQLSLSLHGAKPWFYLEQITIRD